MTTDPIAAARALIEYLSAEQDDEAAQVVATLADALEAERTRAEKAESERDALAAVTYQNAALLSEVQRREGVENSFYNDGWCACASVVADAIRALTPADAQAALDKMLAEARLEGWRAGRDAAARSCVLSGQDLAEGDWGPEGRAMTAMLEARILALPEPKEASHD